MGVEIRRVNGGVPQGNKRHGFPLVQQRGDLAGVFLVGRLQPRRVPGHGSGAVEERFALRQRANNGQGGFFALPLVGDGDNIRFPEDSLGLEGQELGVPGPHAHTI